MEPSGSEYIGRFHIRCTTSVLEQLGKVHRKQCHRDDIPTVVVQNVSDEVALPLFEPEATP